MNLILAAVHNFRVHITGLGIEVFARAESREMKLAYTELQRAKMWMGKALGEWGEESPYAADDNPFSDSVSPPSDIADENPAPVDGETPIQQVKHLRTEAQLLIDGIQKFVIPSQMSARGLVYFEQGIIHLIEAKMWMGMALPQIATKVTMSN